MGDVGEESVYVVGEGFAGCDCLADLAGEERLARFGLEERELVRVARFGWSDSSWFGFELGRGGRGRLGRDDGVLRVVLGVSEFGCGRVGLLSVIWVRLSLSELGYRRRNWRRTLSELKGPSDDSLTMRYYVSITKTIVHWAEVAVLT